jgi:hypothetical protein
MQGWITVLGKGWQEYLKKCYYLRQDCEVRLANLIYEFSSVSGLRSQRFMKESRITGTFGIEINVN